MENKDILVELTYDEYNKAITLTKNLYPEYNEKFYDAINLAYNEKLKKMDYALFEKLDISDVPDPDNNTIFLMIAIAIEDYNLYKQNVVQLTHFNQFKEYSLINTKLEPLIKQDTKTIAIKPVFKITKELSKKFNILTEREFNILPILELIGNGDVQIGLRKLINYEYDSLEGGFYV